MALSVQGDRGHATRVLYLIDDFGIGGAQSALLSQAAALDPDRFEVHVATLRRVAGDPLEPAFRAAGIAVHDLTAADEPFGVTLLRLHSLLKTLRPDIVHTHLAAAGITGRIMARVGRVPHVVSTLHNVSDWTEHRRQPLRTLDRATLRLADRICAVSNAAREAVVRAAPALAPRTITLRNGVAVERFRVAEGAREGARARLGFAPADFVVASVGRLEPGKGLATLLHAAARASARAPMLQLLLVGDGSERPMLERLATTLAIEDWVTFTGTRDDVPLLLAAADMFALPSRREGVGVAAIEALAAGLPVLASRVGGLPEIVTDGVCGRLLPPEDTTAWADALTRAASEPATIEPWRRAAPRRAHAFSIEASVAVLEQLYDSLAAAATAHRRAA